MSQRANYLRRCAPLLGKDRCPKCRRAALVTARIDVSTMLDIARGTPCTIPGRTTCPSCEYDATHQRVGLT